MSVISNNDEALNKRLAAEREFKSTSLSLTPIRLDDYLTSLGLRDDTPPSFKKALIAQWEREEKIKADKRKQNMLQYTKALREVQRIDQEQKRERERQEAKLERKREREEEREKNDPTPHALSAAAIPKIPFEIRDQHIYVPGMTRHGKSSLLFHLIMDDIENNRGVAVLDPIKGDLVTELLPHIPERRLKDCIYLDLKHPIPIDIMRPTPYPEHLVGDIKEFVLKGDTTLKRAEPILTRLIYALLSLPGSKFTDIEDVFTLPKRKKWFLDGLEAIDPHRFEYWKNNWPSGAEFSPLLARMTDFTENPSLRIILGDADPILNLRTAMDERKIILVSLPGDSEVTQIYGTMLISRFQQAAYSRSDIPKNQRQPFCLYVDEFEMFQTASFTKILQAAGGLKLYLTLGNQHIHQLTDDIRHGVFGNVGTVIVFKIREGFDLFSTIIHPYKPYRLGLIPKHQAIFKIGDNAPQFYWTKAPPHFSHEMQNRAERIREILISQTKDTYAQSSQKRSVDNNPCNILPVPHHESNDHQEKSEPIAGAAPSHERRETRKP